MTDASGRKVVFQVVNGANGEHRLLFDAKPDVVAAAPLFRTNNKTDEAADIENSKANLLAQVKVIDRSGQVNANEKADLRKVKANLKKLNNIIYETH